MTEPKQSAAPKLTPDRRVVVWHFVLRQIEKAGPDTRAADAYRLVNQQLCKATEEGGKE